MNTISSYKSYNNQFNVKKSDPSFKMQIKCQPEAYRRYAKIINPSQGDEYLKEIFKFMQFLFKDVKGTMWMITKKDSEGIFIGYERLNKTGENNSEKIHRYYINPFITGDEPSEKIYTREISKHLGGNDNGSLGQVIKISRQIDRALYYDKSVPVGDYRDIAIPLSNAENRIAEMASKESPPLEFQNLLINTRDMFPDKTLLPTLDDKINNALALLYSEKRVSDAERKAAFVELRKLCQGVGQTEEEKKVVNELKQTFNATDTDQLSQIFTERYKASINSPKPRRLLDLLPTKEEVYKIIKHMI